MGCIDSRFEAEEQVCIAENRLGFKDIPVDLINTTMRKYSYKSKINQAQLERINDLLNLNFFPFVYSTKAFINSMLKPDRTFSLKELLVLGILLGCGQAEEKAGLIYLVFDEMLENSIKKIRISTEVLKIISKVSVEYTPNLLSKNDYFAQLLEKQENVIKSIMEKFPAERLEISEQEFIKWMSNFENGSLLTAKGWRYYSKKLQRSGELT